MSIFYHNITAHKFNILELEDVVESMTNYYDVIFYTKSGDAIIKPLTQEMTEGLQQMIWYMKNEL